MVQQTLGGTGLPTLWESPCRLLNLGASSALLGSSRMKPLAKPCYFMNAGETHGDNVFQKLKWLQSTCLYSLIAWPRSFGCLSVCADTAYASISFLCILFPSNDRPYETTALMMQPCMCPEFHDDLQDKLFRRQPGFLVVDFGSFWGLLFSLCCQGFLGATQEL